MQDGSEAADFPSILAMRRVGDGTWQGDPGPGVGKQLFGGHALAQGLMAASLAETDNRLVHSLHANFLNAGLADKITRFEVATLAESRSFARRRVDAFQDDDLIMTMTVSLQGAEDGFEHSDDMPKVVPVDVARKQLEAWQAAQDDFAALPILGRLWQRPVETVPLEVQSLFGGRPQAPRSGCWMRVRGADSCDANTARAQLAYASDMLFLRNAMLPHGIRPGDRRMQVASLDHSMWFHRTPEFANWHLYATQSPWAGAARGLNEGRFFTADGLLVATVAQENLMRIRRD